MPRISPFVGLVYDRSRVGSLERVTAPPYDTVLTEERRRLLDASPYNVVRLDLGEELPEDDVESKYRRAARELERWRAEGILVPTPAPSYFAYEMRFAFQGRPRSVRGLTCLVRLEDWGGSIVPHERTMPGPVEDRLHLMRALRANLSSIYLVCSRPCPDLTDLLDDVCSEQPMASLVDEAGVTHRMWWVDADRGDLQGLQSQSFMIADGHHRYTMALRYRAEMRDRHGPGPWDDVMALVVDAGAENPPVLPIHRVLASEDPPTRGVRVRDLAEVLQEVSDRHLVYGIVTREDGELVHLVDRLEGRPPLVCALHAEILDGLPAPLSYTPDAALAEEEVRRRGATAAFILPPTTATRIWSVVGRGERLPEKSTYFWPKPRTGMVIRPLD
ncbi:MAG TPA: DUF1015 domain-containing protein [Actinomycetota bacterium]|nr:DUF1015 domain-containing protein [Actinomycetota bacterium]